MGSKEYAYDCRIASGGPALARDRSGRETELPEDEGLVEGGVP